MIRLFAGYSMWLKVLILLGFSAQFAVSSAYADAGPSMLSIPTQSVVANQLFTYRIAVDNPNADRLVGMRLMNAPKGATLTDNGDSSYEFRWTPSAKLSEQTVIIVQAFYLAAPNVISTQRLVLQRGSAKPVQAAASKASASVPASVPASVVVASNNAIGSRFITQSNKAASSAVATVDSVGTTETDATPAAKMENTITTAKVETRETEKASIGYTSKFKTKPSVSDGAVENQSASSGRATQPGKAADASSALASLAMPATNPATNVDSIVSDRPELPKLGLQRLTVGEEFQFFIRPVAAGDAQVQLSAESLPVGATFEDIFEGSKMLRWTPSADQVGAHQLVLVLVAEDASNLSLRTEREVMFVVEPAPPAELAPELVFEPMSAQIVSAGRRVNIRVEPKVSDDKIALLHVDRLPAGGSFDENKDGTRTFHWPTTQADQGEHTFRFTAIHPDNAELVANVNVLIVVGSPDGPASGPNTLVASESAPPSPELDPYPSADSPSPSAALPSPESPSSVDSPSPEPYPSADTASPEPLAVKPPPPPRPSPN